MILPAVSDDVSVEVFAQPCDRFWFYGVCGEVFVLDDDRAKALLVDEDVWLSLVTFECAVSLAICAPARVHAVQQSGDAAVELGFVNGHWLRF